MTTTRFNPDTARENAIKLIRDALAAPVENLAEELAAAHRCTVFELNGELWADIQKNYGAGVMTLQINGDYGCASFSPYTGEYAAVTVDLFSEDVEAIRDAANAAGLLQFAELNAY